MDQWYYSRNAQQFGPVSWEELYRLASTGEIAPTDLVWREGMPNWAEARTIQNLFPPAPPSVTSVQQQPAPLPGAGPQSAGYPQPVMPVNYYGPQSTQYAAPGPRPKNYLVQSILVTLCCCLPFGIVAIVYSAQVNSRWDRGDYEGAMNASKSANTWGIVAFICGLIAGGIRLAIVLGNNGKF